MAHDANSRKRDLDKRKERRIAWLKANGPCACGSWEDLEVHHEDPAQKISHNVWSWSFEKRTPELAKCRPVCEKCHTEITAQYCRERFQKPITHGTVSGYLKRACRCDVCKEFYRKWRRNKYERLGI